MSMGPKWGSSNLGKASKIKKVSRDHFSLDPPPDKAVPLCCCFKTIFLLQIWHLWALIRILKTTSFFLLKSASKHRNISFTEKFLTITPKKCWVPGKTDQTLHKNLKIFYVFILCFRVSWLLLVINFPPPTPKKKVLPPPLFVIQVPI